jgi:crossover junction endodeoxyribonuclease RuvC
VHEIRKEYPAGLGPSGALSPNSNNIAASPSHSETVRAAQAIYVGIDPGGVSGGLAAISVADGGPRLLDAIDVPLSGSGARQRVDVLGVRSWLLTHRPVHCFIERAGSRPGQGSSSTFKYARATGALEATVTCLEIPMTIVEPATWKRYFGLKGPDKELSRQRALQLLPAAHRFLALRKHHGRAEAALIALYGGRS